uniref:ATP synthase complex subunit 8 n=1 Tax=Campodea fragilis TaxID=383857 RepID=Q0ZD15_9HEXA|nr:ATP synthase F0 subunit 8 [Campodea fragilis]ABF49565.1 ATP synthase F0 subunit 8 [Campodea fragilis]
MPQMMPLNWLLLFLLFTLSWIMFSIKIYFSVKNYSSSSYSKINSNKMNWSW